MTLVQHHIKAFCILQHMKLCLCDSANGVATPTCWREAMPGIWTLVCLSLRPMLTVTEMSDRGGRVPSGGSTGRGGKPFNGGKGGRWRFLRALCWPASTEVTINVIRACYMMLNNSKFACTPVNRLHMYWRSHCLHMLALGDFSGALKSWGL